MSPDRAARRAAALAEITGEIDPIDQAIAEAGHIVSNAPYFELTGPRKIGWFAFEWGVKYGDETVAQGRAYSERAAVRRRWKAYVKADAAVVAERAADEQGCE